MEQLLLHLFGDYITQTDWMANNKTKNKWPAFVHALVYSIPFWYFIPMSFLAGAIILVSHFVIDHYRLARYVIFAKNWLTNPNLTWKDCSATGYHKDVPIYLSLWLMIISDNFLHLLINYSVIKWL